MLRITLGVLALNLMSAAGLAAQAFQPSDLLPMVATSTPGVEGHYLWVATRIAGSDSVAVRLVLTTHGAPGWTEADSGQRSRLGTDLEGAVRTARARGASIAFLLYPSMSVILEHLPGSAGFTLDGKFIEWAPDDSLLVLSIDRIDGVGGVRAIRTVRIAAPFRARVPSRAFNATIRGVVNELQSDPVAGELLRPSSAPR